MRRLFLAVLFALLAAVAAAPADDFNPYYPHRTFPKLITPQWVGEDGVEASSSWPSTTCAATRSRRRSCGPSSTPQEDRRPSAPSAS